MPWCVGFLKVCGSRSIVAIPGSVRNSKDATIIRPVTPDCREMSATMFFRMIYDDGLAQAAYLIGCQRTGEAILIDPERDIDRYLNLAASQGLRITAVAETHIHADYLSGVREVAEHLDAKVLVSGEGGDEWSPRWLERRGDGQGPYDYKMLHDGDTFRIGNIRFDVMHSPGHTPEHISFLVTDEGAGSDEPIGIVTGDFVFVGDVGRPDLLETAAGQAGKKEASAHDMAKSARRFLDLPEFLQVWPAHGAGSACGKALGAVPQSTVGYERRFNPALQLADNENEFVNFILEGQPEPPLYFARMKRENRDGPPLLGELPPLVKLKPDQIAAIDGKTMGVIDLRPWNEFRDFHLKGSLWTVTGPNFSAVTGSYIEPEEDIILIAEPDQLEKCTRALVRIGLDRVIAWASAETLIEAHEQFRGNFSDTPEIDVTEAAKRMDDPNTIVLDVRRATEHAEGAIPGAINVAHTRLFDRLDDIPRDREILVHCRSGVRSAFASAALARRGFNVTNVAGGFLAWEKAELPVERPEPSQPISS